MVVMSKIARQHAGKTWLHSVRGKLAWFSRNTAVEPLKPTFSYESPSQPISPEVETSGEETKQGSGVAEAVSSQATVKCLIAVEELEEVPVNEVAQDLELVSSTSTDCETAKYNEIKTQKTTVSTNTKKRESCFKNAIVRSFRTFISLFRTKFEDLPAEKQAKTLGIVLLPGEPHCSHQFGEYEWYDEVEIEEDGEAFYTDSLHHKSSSNAISSRALDDKCINIRNDGARQN